jgi:hypothetical protein
MFKKRIYDIAGFDIGYTMNIFGIVRIRHVKVRKIMEAERYVTFITIFRTEYIKDQG